MHHRTLTPEKTMDFIYDINDIVFIEEKQREGIIYSRYLSNGYPLYWIQYVEDQQYRYEFFSEIQLSLSGIVLDQADFV